MKKYTLTLLLIVGYYVVFAQQDTLHKNRKTYFGIGFSLGTGGDQGGYSDAYFYLQRESTYVALKSSGVSQFDFFGDEPIPILSDAGIIIGKSYMLNKSVSIQFGCGIAYTEQISKGAFLYNTCMGFFCIFGHNVYETITTRSIGFPIEARTNLLLGSASALTIGLNGNLNKEPFYGLSVGFVFGRLRDRVKKH